VILSSPIWLYQIWAFVAPGLHPYANLADDELSPLDLPAPATRTPEH